VHQRAVVPATRTFSYCTRFAVEQRATPLTTEPTPERPASTRNIWLGSFGT